MSAPRQMVSVRYNVYNDFVVPRGVDLNGDKVKDWFVKWDRLHIQMKNGKEYEIEGRLDPCDGGNFKHHDGLAIEESTYEDSDDEEDEESICEGCGQVESVECKTDCSYQAKRTKEEEETWGETCDECGFELKFNSEKEFDESPQRDVGYNEDGQWVCEKCRSKNDDEEEKKKCGCGKEGGCGNYTEGWRGKEWLCEDCYNNEVEPETKPLPPPETAGANP